METWRRYVLSGVMLAGFAVIAANVADGARSTIAFSPVSDDVQIPDKIIGARPRYCGGLSNISCLDHERCDYSHIKGCPSASAIGVCVSGRWVNDCLLTYKATAVSDPFIPAFLRGKPIDACGCDGNVYTSVCLARPLPMQFEVVQHDDQIYRLSKSGALTPAVCQAVGAYARKLVN